MLATCRADSKITKYTMLPITCLARQHQQKRCGFPLFTMPIPQSPPQSPKEQFNWLLEKQRFQKLHKLQIITKGLAPSPLDTDPSPTTKSSPIESQIVATQSSTLDQRVQEAFDSIEAIRVQTSLTSPSKAEWYDIPLKPEEYATFLEQLDKQSQSFQEFWHLVLL
jgi:hypothetical protein